MSLKNTALGDMTKNQMMCAGLPAGFRTPCTVLLESAGQCYEYVSKPKVVGNAGVKGAKPTRKLVDYHNVMWDPRVYRGRVNKTEIFRNPLCCKTNLMKGCPKKPPRHRFENKLGGICRPKTPPSTKAGFGDMGIQTDRFLEEITDEVLERDMCTQTDKTYDFVVPPMYIPIKPGLDVETQIMPWELFSFDEEVRPIVVSLVGKVIEQSLFESMEEAELDSLLAQQRVFEERHRMELLRLARLHKREQRLTEERQRLIAQRQIEVGDEENAENMVSINCFVASYLSQLANGAFDDLRNSGFLYRDNDITVDFTPWLTEQSVRKVKAAATFNGLLDAIIHHVVEEREAQIALGMWMRYSYDFNKEARGEDDEEAEE